MMVGQAAKRLCQINGSGDGIIPHQQGLWSFHENVTEMLR